MEKYDHHYLKEENTQLTTTLSHAAIVERAIGTIKNMLYKRLEFEPNKPWWGEVLQQLIFLCNNGRACSTQEMTPSEARKASNEEKAKEISENMPPYVRN